MSPATTSLTEGRPVTEFFYVPLCSPLPGGGCDERWHNPCGSPGKVPRMAAWQHAGRIQRPEGNAGVLVGPDHGILVVEIDGPDELAVADSWGLPQTYTVRSGRVEPGFHRYYAWPHGVTAARVPDRYPARAGGVQLKKKGQVVAPGSLHQSGRLYEIWDRRPIAEVPHGFVVELLKVTAPRPVRERTDVDQSGIDIGAALERAGWRLDHERGQQYWTRPGKGGGISATYDGSCFYVFTAAAEAHPFEPGTGYSPWAVVALLEHNGDYAAAARALGIAGENQGSGQRDPADKAARRRGRAVGRLAATWRAS